MGLYNDASLIVYPSGYKAGKIYSQKPTDGSGDLTFTRASTATRVNESGLVESVASGVPRIDYTGGGCGKFKFEPQRTNLVIFSEDFTDAVWRNTRSATLVTTAADYSPDGNLTGNKFEQTLTSDRRALWQDSSITANVPHTLSVFLKQGTAGTNMFRITIAENGNQSNWTSVQVNLNDNSLIVGDGSTNTFTNISSSISDFSYNGYYLLQLTATHPTATSLRSLFSICDATDFTISPTDSYSRPDYLGTGDFVYVWGAQLEQSSYPTSYIPTAGATATRLADASTTTDLSSVIGQTEGVLYAKIASFINTSPINYPINISDGSIDNQIAMWYGTNLNEFKTLIRQSGNKLFHTTTLTDATEFIKVAVLYKSGGSKVYINGSLITSNTNSFAFTNTLSVLDFYGLGLGNKDFNGKLQELMLFPAALTDLQLEELTTL